MPANPYKPKPANKVYIAANGHKMEMAPKFSNHSGWYFVYATAWHHESCWCHTSEESNYDLSEYAGEEE